MTTYEQSRNRPISTLFIFIFFSFIALVLFSVSFPTFVNGRTHAEEKHGQQINVKKCRNMFDAGGAFQIWKNNKSKHCALLIEEVSNGGKDMMERGKRWIVRIVDSVTGEEITMFPIEGSLMFAEEYFMRTGYAPISP